MEARWLSQLAATANSTALQVEAQQSTTAASRGTLQTRIVIQEDDTWLKLSFTSYMHPLDNRASKAVVIVS
jgi:hypothetical protein